MLIRRLLESWTGRRRPGAEHAPSANVSTKEAEHLTGFNWLVRGRHGIYVANDNDIYVGRALIHYGEFSELEWALLRAYCQPGDTVIEVGAHIGAHTVSLSKAVGPQGRVVAIEPQPAMFQALCANLALNCLANVEAHQCGCGRAAGTMSVPLIDYASEGNFAAISLGPRNDTGLSQPVPVRPLDDVVAGHSRVDLIKIDVEGMEAEVLAGAGGVIGRFLPPLYVENDRLPKSKALIETLAAMGYRMWWHTPPLYNPDNYYGSSRNLYPNIASFNMLCLHETKAEAEAAPEGLREVTDSSTHPLVSR